MAIELKNLLSACLIVKNEENDIKKCLESIREHVDEIVVVDTGSTDRTVELAKQFTDKVLSFPWVNDFSAARNFSLDHAKNDFVFIIDADSILLEWDEAGVKKFMETSDSHQVGCVKIVNLVGEKRSSDFQIKVFNRKYCHYEGIIHEQVVANESTPLQRLPLKIVTNHNGYNPTNIAAKKKTERNIILLQLALQQKGDDCYLLYHLAKGYDAQKDYSRALECYEKAISAIDNFSYLYVRKLIVDYGYAFLHSGDYKGALCIENYRKYYSENPDYTFVLAYIYMMNARFDKAVELFLQCTKLSGEEVEGTTSWRSLYNVGVIYECLGQHSLALSYYRQCGNYPKAQQRIALLSRS